MNKIILIIIGFSICSCSQNQQEDEKKELLSEIQQEKASGVVIKE